MPRKRNFHATTQREQDGVIAGKRPDPKVDVVVGLQDAIGRDRRLQAFGIQLPAKALAACLVGIVHENPGIELAVEIEKDLVRMKAGAREKAKRGEGGKKTGFSGAWVHVFGEMW